MKRVFLGGTCSLNTNWREEMIELLDKSGLEYFNPELPEDQEWNEEAQENERRARSDCDFIVYTITPQLTGVYSIAEVVEDSVKRPDRTIFIVLKKDGPREFDEGEWKSLEQVVEMVVRNGAYYCTTLEAAVLHIHHETIEVAEESIDKRRIYSIFDDNDYYV